MKSEPTLLINDSASNLKPCTHTQCLDDHPSYPYRPTTKKGPIAIYTVDTMIVSDATKQVVDAWYHADSA